MKDLIKGYIYLGGIVGTAVLTYQGVEGFLNDVYKPEQNFDKETAQSLLTAHKIIAGAFALKNTAAVANVLGRMLYKIE